MAEGGKGQLILKHCNLLLPSLHCELLNWIHGTSTLLGYSSPWSFFRETFIWKMSASEVPQILLTIEIRGGFWKMSSFERQIKSLPLLMFLLDCCFLRRLGSEHEPQTDFHSMLVYPVFEDLLLGSIFTVLIM